MNRWFATARTGRWVHRDSDYRFDPVGLTHAKTMGTTLTACGLPVSSWPKFWAVAFGRALPPGCQGCVECRAAIASSAHVGR